MLPASAKITCPSCEHFGAEGFSPYSRLWNVVRCNSCGHAFVPETDGETNTHFEESGYLAWREGLSKMLRDQAARRAKLVLSKVDKQGGKVLELGCSTGEVLSVLAREGWDAYGVDLSERAIEAGRRRYPEIHLEVGTEELFLSLSTRPRFDLITAFHVVEHVRDVDRLVRNCRELLAPGGYLAFFVPNWKSWSRVVFRDCWPDFMPEHIHLFCEASMARLLQRHAFRVVYASTKGKSWPWLGGMARAIKGVRPPTSPSQPHVMPGALKMKVLQVGDVVLSPFFLLEKLLHGGNELQVIAKDASS
jgi:SAM-dependent methyltransferase